MSIYWTIDLSSANSIPSAPRLSVRLCPVAASLAFAYQSVILRRTSGLAGNKYRSSETICALSKTK